MTLSARSVIVLAFVFGWLPTFGLSVLCGGLLIGLLASLVKEVSEFDVSGSLSILMYMIWMVAGLLGFWGLSAVIFTSRLGLSRRILFLTLGVVSVISAGITFWPQFSATFPFYRNHVFTLIYCGVFVGPAVCGILYIIYYYRLIRSRLRP